MQGTLWDTYSTDDLRPLMFYKLQTVGNQPAFVTNSLPVKLGLSSNKNILVEGRIKKTDEKNLSMIKSIFPRAQPINIKNNGGRNLSDFFGGLSLIFTPVASCRHLDLHEALKFHFIERYNKNFFIIIIVFFLLFFFLGMFIKKNEEN